MSLLTPDICVVGAGSAGLTVAAAAAAFGVDVVLVERSRMGGDCLNTGCVPSKALIAAGRRAQAMRGADAFGIRSVEPDIDYAAVQRRVRAVIAGIAPHDSQERFTGLGVTVIRAEAAFEDAQTLSAGGQRIRARRFVLATGSAPVVPPIPGIDTVPVLTNETIFELDRLPEHLLVVGGGPIGIELAQAHRRLGAAVTIVEAGTALSKEDPELVEVVLGRLRAEGVTILERATVLRIGPAPEGGVALAVQDPAGGETVVLGSHLLVAAGRRVVTDGLRLERAGIEADSKGIRVGPDLRTANRRVYAIGDAAGGPQFTHAAAHQAGLAVRSILFRLPIDARKVALPRVTYSEPELGQVGLTEAEARARGMKVTVLRAHFDENDRARTDGCIDGLLKLIVGRGGRILGAGIAGEGAGEMTNLFSLVLSRRLKLSALQGFVAPYPTLGEVAKRAATAYYAPHAQNRAVRVAIRLLQRFG
ncbi:FAD-dependent oxidoreductase [Aurantimonas sp. MSK8Z-1]|uniref:dihydrolipoyl dehydrogenase family protein n=1 Tax=Mangrovibrevibacter kandeliae TaxID=2968473 RepID=UPI002118AA93|nr:FAD-dependent oxidoreductase [Aurantimonas sp. MSK8Z-1]MCW4116434.1 FAD-dependent oxidoreductase [Aurantimonas sp. MSK8Z-1]